MNLFARIVSISALLVSATILLLNFGDRDSPAGQRETRKHGSLELLDMYGMSDVVSLYSDLTGELGYDTKAVFLYNFTDVGLHRVAKCFPRIRAIGLHKYWIGSGPPEEDLCSPLGIEELLALPDLQLLEITNHYSLNDQLLHKLAHKPSLKRVYLKSCSGFSLQTALTLRPGFFRVIR